MPSSMRRYFCKLCGAAYATARTDRLFCSDEHRKSFNQERIKQGLRIIDLAIASRIDRSSANIANANKARRDLYNEIARICEDERERLAKRAAKVAEIRSAKSNLPQPVELESYNEIPDIGRAGVEDCAVSFR